MAVLFTETAELQELERMMRHCIRKKRLKIKHADRSSTGEFEHVRVANAGKYDGVDLKPLLSYTGEADIELLAGIESGNLQMAAMMLSGEISRKRSGLSVGLSGCAKIVVRGSLSEAFVEQLRKIVSVLQNSRSEFVLSV